MRSRLPGTLREYTQFELVDYRRSGNSRTASACTSNVRFGIDLQSPTCQRPSLCQGRARRVRPPFFGDSINDKFWNPFRIDVCMFLLQGPVAQPGSPFSASHPG